MSSIEYVLDQGRFKRRQIIEVDLGSQEKVLSNLTEQTNVMLQSFIPFNNRHIHILANNRSIVMLTELIKLPFKTTFDFSPTQPLTHLTPTFLFNPGNLVIDDPWVIPHGLGKCLFGVRLVKGDSGNFQPEKCYLFQYKDSELYRLPYPNTYENGSICMGANWENSAIRNQDVMSHFITAYNSFHETQMNRDLTGDMTVRCFKRNLEGWEYPSAEDCVPFGPNGRGFLTSVSHAFMAGFSI